MSCSSVNGSAESGGSILAAVAQLVEHFIGNEEVESSILSRSTSFPASKLWFTGQVACLNRGSKMPGDHRATTHLHSVGPRRAAWA